MTIHREIGENIVRLRQQKGLTQEQLTLESDMKNTSVSAESFRQPMVVSEIHLFYNKDAFPVCPQCKSTLDREYQQYCDRCGQALNWRKYGKSIVVKMS